MDDPARLIYLLILLAVIGSGVAYMARQNLGKSVQQFLIWMLLLAGLVIVYGYKDVLMGQLFPATGIADDAGLVFYKNTDGHFYINSKVNGAGVKFLVDTGASQIVLDKKTAEKIGFNLDELDFVHKAYTANGVVYGAKVRLKSLRIGEYAHFDVPAMVNGGALSTPLLGMAYLERFGELRIMGERMILRP